MADDRETFYWATFADTSSFFRTYELMDIAIYSNNIGSLNSQNPEIISHSKFHLAYG